MNFFNLFFYLTVIATSSTATALALDLHTATFPRVDADIAEYDATVALMKADFSRRPSNPDDKSWVQRKLAFMVKVDQFVRQYPEVIYHHSYSESEKAYFWSLFGTRFKDVDSVNTTDLKELQKLYDWFRISAFGAEADADAWLLVQHADQDVDFQKRILLVLEKLYPVGETKPAHYAYLFDRVAASWQNPSKRTPQRFGTQGQCVGPGKWEPIPIEAAEKVDTRRAAMGMEPMAVYKVRFKDICH